MSVIIVVEEGSDLWNDLARLLGRCGLETKKALCAPCDNKASNGAGRIVAEPLDVRLLELSSKPPKGD